jgi:hypothetical protein
MSFSNIVRMQIAVAPPQSFIMVANSTMVLAVTVVRTVSWTRPPKVASIIEKSWEFGKDPGMKKLEQKRSCEIVGH